MVCCFPQPPQVEHDEASASNCIFCVWFAQRSLCLCCSLFVSCIIHVANLSWSFFISAFALCFSLLHLSATLSSLSLSQREQQGCAAVWLAAVNGACLSWLTYQWRPRICGRFPGNPSIWLRNWATANLEKSGWVGCHVAVGGKVTAGAHLDQRASCPADTDIS